MKRIDPRMNADRADSLGWARSESARIGRIRENPRSRATYLNVYSRFLKKTAARRQFVGTWVCTLHYSEWRQARKTLQNGVFVRMIGVRRVLMMTGALGGAMRPQSTDT